jgi:hypothetical protein
MSHVTHHTLRVALRFYPLTAAQQRPRMMEESAAKCVRRCRVGVRWQNCSNEGRTRFMITSSLRVEVLWHDQRQQGQTAAQLLRLKQNLNESVTCN